MTKNRPEPSGFTVPMLAFTWAPELLAAIEALKDQAEAVRRARAGFDRFDQQIRAAEGIRDQAKRAIANRAGDAAARKAMGLEEAPENEASVSDIESELAVAEGEVAALTAAKERAPALFEPLRRDLETKRAIAKQAFEGAFGPIEAHLDRLDEAVRALKIEQDFLSYVAHTRRKNFNPSPDNPATFDAAIVDDIAAYNQIIVAALDASKPLVPEAPKPPEPRREIQATYGYPPGQSAQNRSGLR